jgi:hypothetical protein
MTAAGSYPESGMRPYLARTRWEANFTRSLYGNYDATIPTVLNAE